VLIGLAIALIIYVLNRYYGIQFMTVTDETKTDNFETNYCESTSCVRCYKYKATLAKAVIKLRHIEDADIVCKIQAGINHGIFNSTDRQQPNVFYFKELESTPVWKTDMFKESQLLEKSYTLIKNEFDSLMTQDDKGVWKNNRTPQGSWDVIHFINQGKEIAENCSLCPKLMDFIQSMQSTMRSNVFGNVMFSIVKPGTVISEHYGPTNIRLRCHLGVYSSYNQVKYSTQTHLHTKLPLTLLMHTLYNNLLIECFVFIQQYLYLMFIISYKNEM